MKSFKIGTLTMLPLTLALSTTALADQVTADDLIIIGSACVGIDCNTGESFGFDTIRLKENNLRIRFIDTSSSSSFPTNDWQITVNDSANGGANKFSIEDIDGEKVPFTIEAGAPNHSLYVDSQGLMGLGTSTPIVEMHMVNGDSPTLRLEQDGSSGFTPQTWDVAGNETNFFVRDVTNSATLPFRIRSGAPNNALFIDTNGNVGIGTSAPNANLEVRNSAGSTLRLAKDSVTYSELGVSTAGKVTLASTSSSSSVTTPVMNIVDNNGSTDAELMLNLQNNGPSYLGFDDTTNAYRWILHNAGSGDFKITQQDNSSATPAYKFPFVISPDGDLTVTGVVSGTGSDFTSSRALKENLSNIDTQSILNKVSSLAISQWNYIKDHDSKKHIGPMAEDFHQAFGLNGDKTDKISVSDISGISLASIIALKELSDKKDKQIAILEKRIQQLENQQ